MRILRPLVIVLLAAALAACGGRGAGDVVEVAFIGDPAELDVDGLRLAPSAQHLRAATAEGLVTLDADGNVVPALAERWIVTDDGLSYIFRLRNSQWPDGTRIDGDNVRGELQRTISRLRGTSLGLDLAKIDEVRAMTGRVVEIRLKGPMPQLLQVLAQPEMGLRRNGRGAGPMAQREDDAVRVLSPLPPEQRGLPRNEEWRQSVRDVRLQVLAPEQAVAAFNDGRVDLVLGGTLANLPLADVGALSRGTVRLDAALGLFGLQVHRARGVLGDAALREAVAMAIDRDSLMAPFNIGGWEATTRIVPPGLPEDIGTQGERWDDMTFEERQAAARRRVAGWRATAAETPKATIALPRGPGSDRLFDELAGDLSAVGITLVRVDDATQADLVLVDRIARYGGARWFLNQFNCKLVDGPCSVEADARVAESLTATDPLANAALLSEAEAELASTSIYIPIGAPIRWSLVRGGVDGFVENRWNLHPLFPLSKRPI